MRLSCKVRLFASFQAAGLTFSPCVSWHSTEPTEAYRLTTARCDVPCWWWMPRGGWQDPGVRTPMYFWALWLSTAHSESEPQHHLSKTLAPKLMM